jgi:ribonucleotide reductase alpha subunit
VASGSGKPAGAEKQPRYRRQPRSSHGLRRADQQADVHPSAEGGDITLFSPSDVPGLYDAFFADQDEFERLYTQYEQDDSIRKQRIKAVELFSLMMQERASTGRIYIQNVDHCNTHSPFDPVVAPVRQSNLCLEIAADQTAGRRQRRKR